SSSRSGTVGTATFTVTFSESVANGSSIADYSLFGTSTSGSVTNVTGSGTTRTVTVGYTSNPGGDRGKTLGLNLKSGTTAADAAGNIATGSTFSTAQISSLAPAGIAGSPINLGLRDM